MKIEDCKFCGLHETRKNIVWMRGSDMPDILFIGEAPGEHEDIQGIPFVGQSGEILDRAIENSGITNFAITNVVKCRPPSNRKPTNYEVSQCAPYLEDQILELNPKLIVCLGAVAYSYFFQGKPTITQITNETVINGDYKEHCDRKIVAVFHPAYVLRGGITFAEYCELFDNIKSILEAICQETT